MRPSVGFPSLLSWPKPWLVAIAVLLGIGILAVAAKADTPKTLTVDQDPITDPAGVNGATPAAKKGDAPPAGSMTVPNPTSGLNTGTVDAKGNFKPYAG